MLLTGARGFVGRHATPALAARGFDVHAVSRCPPAATGEDLTWHQADLLAPGACAALVDDIRPSHLLHLAWVTRPGEYWRSAENLAWVQASIGLLRAFADHGGQRAVLAGSCAEYDWRFGYCVEDVTPCKSKSVYTASKIALQEIADAFSRAAGVSTAWARLFFLFGPHEQRERLVPDVIRALLAGGTAACTDGRQVRDFLYVKDAAEALSALLDHTLVGRVNIASGQPLAVKDVVLRIADKLGARESVALGARARPDADPPLLIGDITRLTAGTGWRPRYALDAALDETIDWWREHME